MAEDESAQPSSAGVLKVQQALSGRSTCKATGEKIEKGDWRVGMDVWTAGRVAVAWQVCLIV